jgi:hypothetical protein
MKLRRRVHISELICLKKIIGLHHVLVSGASFPVHENLSISDMDLESKYCYFYHSWDFVPYYMCIFPDMFQFVQLGWRSNLELLPVMNVKK